MKIKNNQKTHFLKISKCGLYQIKYDTVENVNSLINHILDNGDIKILSNIQNSMQSISAIKKEL